MSALVKHLSEACSEIDAQFHSGAAKQDRTNYLRGRKSRIKTNSRWPSYESAKQSWLDKNPNCTPAEYQAAMTRIARECGV